jgi:selT/selW/selH-like putative selenoprotein
LQQRFGAQVELIEGARGAFEVRVDGHLIFSKTSEGRFPKLDELITHLQ